MIAALGIIQDSIDPDHRRDGRRPGVRPARRALRRPRPATADARTTLAARARRRLPVGIAAAFALTLVLRRSESAPDELAEPCRGPATLFISHPDEYSVLVALLAGVAGALSLSTAKSGALVGVLISVTTIPAAANVGVAAAYGDWSEMAGARRPARGQPHVHRHRRRRDALAPALGLPRRRAIAARAA